MGTPAAAMLWECWRLTRRSMLLVMFGFMPIVILLLMWPGSVTSTIWFVLWAPAVFVNRIVSKNVTLSSGYVRPVPTWLLAGVPMAYLCFCTVAAFLIPVLFLMAFSGISFAVVTACAQIAALTLWFSPWRNRAPWHPVVTLLECLVIIYVFRTFGSHVILPWHVAGPHGTSGFSLTDYGVTYGLIAMLAVSSIWSTLKSVERGRHGDDQVSSATASTRHPSGGAAVQNPAASPRRPGWFRMPCPTSSPTAAQLWFEMRTRGVAVLRIGVWVALGIPVLLSVANADWDYTIFVVGCLFAMLHAATCAKITFRFSGTKENRYMSSYDATLALGTARLAGLKVLVSVVCILAVWAAILTGFRASLFMGVIEVNTFGQRFHEAAAALLALPTYDLAALAAVALILCSASVAYVGSDRVSLLSNFKGETFVASGIGLYLLALLIGLMMGWVAPSFAIAHLWIAAVLIPMETVYVFRKALVDRILTPRHTGIAVLLWAVFAAVYLALLRDFGWLYSGEPWALIALLVSSSLVPLAAVAQAPRSLGLIRHR